MKWFNESVNTCKHTRIHTRAQLCGKADKGRDVLMAAVGSSPHLKQLWEAALQFEEACGLEGLVERVLPLYERAITEQVRAGGRACLCLCVCVRAGMDSKVCVCKIRCVRACGAYVCACS